MGLLFGTMFSFFFLGETFAQTKRVNRRPDLCPSKLRIQLMFTVKQGFKPCISPTHRIRRYIGYIVCAEADV